MEYLIRGTLWLLILISSSIILKAKTIREAVHAKGCYGRSD